MVLPMWSHAMFISEQETTVPAVSQRKMWFPVICDRLLIVMRRPQSLSEPSRAMTCALWRTSSALACILLR